MAGTLLPTKGMKSFGRYGSVGFELLASIAVGYYVGHWLDGKFGTRWIGFVGFVLGCYAGFRSLFATAKQMQRDIEREEKLERGEDPWAEEAYVTGETANGHGAPTTKNETSDTPSSERTQGAKPSANDRA